MNLQSVLTVRLATGSIFYDVNKEDRVIIGPKM